MLPLIKAIGFAFSAINAVSTIKSAVSSTTGTAAKTETPMNTVQNNAAAASPAAANAGAAPGIGETQDRFLKLLVTQMKNQDPLNPLDNAQVTTQLAQINTVSGIEKLNTTLQNMSTSFLAGQSLQSAALIGRQVLTDGNRIAYAGAPVAGGAELAQAADKVTVTIEGAAGNVVRQLELGPQQAGALRFQWDGLDNAGAKAANGTYSVRVTAQKGGQQIAATPHMIGRVGSVSFGSDGLRIDVDGIGPVQLFQIKRII